MPFVLVLEIISIITFEFEFLTAILRVTPRLTTQLCITGADPGGAQGPGPPPDHQK